MAKKNLKDIETNLAVLAAPLPTQHVESARPPAVTPARIKEKKVVSVEPEVQFSFAMPASVRRQLAIKAVEADMTMRGYILAALREKGIEVDDAVIADARRKD